MEEVSHEPITSMFNNIENNGAPWAFLPLLEVTGSTRIMVDFKVPTMGEMLASGESPEVLFWVGCAGSFDDRAKRITKAIAKILNYAGVKLLFWELKKAAIAIQLKEQVTSSYSKCRLPKTLQSSTATELRKS